MLRKAEIVVLRHFMRERREQRQLIVFKMREIVHYFFPCSEHDHLRFPIDRMPFLRHSLVYSVSIE